jgi:uncharacterized protein (TIGR00661 family)
MIKILYAAGQTGNSKIQLNRFASEINNTDNIVKFAAFNKYSGDTPVDWSLDCLLNIFKPEYISVDNENFHIYFEQIKSFAPDLIISDLEYFTSHIAITLNIPLWQCSSSLINIGISHYEKYNLGIFKNYAYLLHKRPKHNARIANIIDNSDHNFIYSHLGDVDNAPKLKDNFEWIRPYTNIGKISKPCSHNIIAGLNRNNKKIFNVLQKYNDCIVFSDFCDEYYPNLLLKDINNSEEYFCNLKNSNIFICEGQSSFLSDAYYNDKYSLVMTDFNDLECIINSIYSESLGLSSFIFNDDIKNIKYNNVISNKKNNIKLLHEKIADI